MEIYISQNGFFFTTSTVVSTKTVKPSVALFKLQLALEVAYHDLVDLEPNLKFK